MILTIYKNLRNVFFILFLIISIYAAKFYEGSVVIFFLYCVSFIWMVFFLTNNKSSYFEIFFSSYLFLGFWFKYVFSLILYKGIVYDAGNASQHTNIDDVLSIGILVANTCFISSFLSKKFFHYKILKYDLANQQFFFQQFYLNNRILLLLLLLIFCVFLAYINNKFTIYQRGLISLVETSDLINNFIKWFLLFGLTTLTCFFLHVEILKQKKINFLTVIISIFVTFASYTSMLSRLFPIIGMAIILPLYQQSKKLKKSYDKLFFLILMIFLFLTAMSIYYSNYIRIEKSNEINNELKNMQNAQSLQDIKDLRQTNINNPKIKEDKTSENLTSNNITSFIIVNRWIGIESIILVHKSKKTSFSLFLESLKEKKKLNIEETFYEKTFGLDKINVATNSKLQKGNTLPGIIGFLYYSGNLYFVLIILFLIIFIFNFFEIFIKQITRENSIFACFISSLIATRLIHFGYVPKDSYLFIISVLSAVFIMCFLLRFRLLCKK